MSPSGTFASYLSFDKCKLKYLWEHIIGSTEHPKVSKISSYSKQLGSNVYLHDHANFKHFSVSNKIKI